MESAGAAAPSVWIGGESSAVASNVAGEALGHGQAGRGTDTPFFHWKRFTRAERANEEARALSLNG